MTMTTQRAVEIADTVTEGVQRWGIKGFGTGRVHPHEIVEALSVLHASGVGLQTDTEDALREEITELRGQLAAAKAREGRAASRYKALKEQQTVESDPKFQP